ncbi:dihydrofolate reductase family protein [uncultured Rhodoblastus sp.]|uniref:RibD family protein n=1 Tax=uncultured Rhodoblastus sp. TaxID=543037 RepID=UPI0025E34AD1|nr:dihydrofolate reductase family protein [uncultured Rhodoblastus sp.]
MPGQSPDARQGASAPEDVFAPFCAAPAHRPFVVAQLGQSLDGRIATISGESRNISGDAALDHLHRLRAHVDAVIVGAGTIVADDPRLSVRRILGQSPARIVIDPSGRLGEGWNWLAEDGVRRLVVCSAAIEPPAGAETILVPACENRIPPAAILDALFALGFRRILVEGGARTIAAFIEEGCLDRLHVLVAPIIIGSGRSGLDLAPEPKLALARRPSATAYLLGQGEVLFDCDFSAYRRNES